MAISAVPESNDGDLNWEGTQRWQPGKDWSGTLVGDAAGLGVTGWIAAVGNEEREGRKDQDDAQVFSPLLSLPPTPFPI